MSQAIRQTEQGSSLGREWLETLNLRATLFGNMELMDGDVSLALPSAANARALLAYLLLHRAHPQPRAVLVGILWPDHPEGRARRYLTQALWQLRQSLPGLIEADAENIQITNHISLQIDVEDFRARLASGLAAEKPAQERRAALRQAVQLYQGDLMEGFYEDWALQECERLRECYFSALENLVGLEKAAGRYHQALDLALTLVGADPLREAAHREVMRLYFTLDRPEAAQRQYETCRQILQDQLGTTAGPETQALAGEIARSNTPESAPYLPPALKATRPAISDVRTRQLSLVGRADERSELLNSAESIFDHLGGVILVEGEAGIGKTRLVQEVARDLEWRGGQVLWGSTSPMKVTPPYGPLAQALGSGLTPLRINQLAQVIEPIWLQVLKPFIAELAAFKPDLPPAPALKSDQEHTRLIEAFVQALSGWAQICPSALILEDLQWADSQTLDLLAALPRRLEDLAVVVIGTQRSEEARSYPALWEKLQAIDRAGLRRRMKLERLNERATGELIRNSLGMSRAAPLFEARLYQETEGNPLFVLETLQVLYEEGVLNCDENGQWSTPWDELTNNYAELPLPPAVEQVIKRRLARLIPSLETVLNSAAVLGSDFDLALLSSSLEIESTEMLNAIQELRQRHFLQETAQAYCFSHDKIRQVIYDNLEATERIRLHRQAGAALETRYPERVDMLAHHLMRGEVWDQAVRALMAQGEKAAGQYLAEAALNAYCQARQILQEQRPFEEAQNQALIFDTWAACYPWLKMRGEPEGCAQAVAAMLEFAGLLGQPEYQVKALLQQAAYLLEIANQDEAAYEIAQQVVALAQTHQLTSFEAQAWWRTGLVRKEQMQNQAAESALLKALELYREVGGEQQIIADILLRLVFVYRDLGNMDKARANAEEALELSRSENDILNLALAHNALAWISRSQGKHQEEADHCQMMYEQMHTIGYLYYEGVALNNLSLAHSALADYERAIQASEKALHVFRNLDHKRGQTIQLLNLSSRYKETGRFCQAKSVLKDGLAVAGAMHFADEAARMHLSYAELLTWEKKFDQAQEHIQEATAIAGQLEYPALHANVAYRQGQLDLAREALPVALAAFEKAKELYGEAGWPDYVHLMTSFAAISHFKLGNLAQARQNSEAAMAGLSESVLEACFHHYQIMAAAGETQTARQALKKAVALIQERLLVAPDEACRAKIRQGIPLHKEILTVWAIQGPRQITIHLPSRTAPGGRPLRQEEQVPVTWTVSAPEDEEITGAAARRQHCLQRLLQEAEAQGAAPTIADLAKATGSSQATVKRDLAALRAAGQVVKTRGSN
ncbi:MAG: AAA family ATPase [Anaerolineales bacterium]|nr:AAA family ATPase [Anaerolineales bacterium]